MTARWTGRFGCAKRAWRPRLPGNRGGRPRRGHRGRPPDDPP